MLVHLCGPEAGFNTEIISAANDREQAAQVFKYVAGIIAQSPMLSAKLKVVESKKRIVYHGRKNVYRAISAEARTKHGLSPIVIIYDELAQARNTELLDALITSQGAHDEPLFLTISTQSHDPQHPFSQMIDYGLSDTDPTVVCHLYEVPETADIFDERVWIGANPALGDFRSLEDMQAGAKEARERPATEGRFRNLFLNQRASQLSTLFSRPLWMGLGADRVVFEPGEEVFLGLDMATTTDLAALAMVSRKGGRLKVHFWKPEDLMEDHGRRDRVDYQLWQKQGFMEPCPGKTINPTFVAQRIIDLCQTYSVLGMAYDRAWTGQLKVRLAELGFALSDDDDGDLKVVPWGQGWRDMSPAIGAIEHAALEGELVHDRNQVLNWNFGNAIVTTDSAGNRVLDKEKSRLRIDGAVAATMAFGLRARMDAPDGPSVYAQRGLITI